MRRIVLLLCLFRLSFPATAATNCVIRTAAELRDLLAERTRIHVPFVLTGVIDQAPHHVNNACMSVIDETGAVRVFANASLRKRELRSGDRVTLSGQTIRYSGTICALCEKATVQAHGTPPTIEDIRCADLADSRHDYRQVAVRGTVRNAFQDELDPNYFILIINDGSASVSAFVPTSGRTRKPADFIGSDVRAVGVCNPRPIGNRLHLRRILEPVSGSDVTILRTSADDVFDVPDIRQLRNKSTQEIVTAGRRKARGHVVTRWDGGTRLILKTEDGAFVNVELSAGKSPAVGSAVEISGVPETDLFRINLSNAVGRPATLSPATEDTPCETTIPRLLADEQGRPKLQPQFHGRPVTVCGTVQNAVASSSNDARLVLEDDGLSLPVDVSACGGVLSAAAPGAQIRVTGVFVVEADVQRLLSSFPRVRNVFLVVNAPADVMVLSAAPFWTTARLTTVIGTLVAILVGILLWSISLRALVMRKTRELEQEIANGIEAELRIHERTRLATELHDSVSQNLTGVALALDEVKTVLPAANADAQARLDIATRTLKSCRSELRNCLWDLRNEALEEPEIDEAIRRTLAPHIRDTKLAIRFRVARETFSDHTLHTILCIIRELTVNAIRHGGAKNVKIAGSLESDELRFSVADDGCGFDPSARPNIETGHFGLQGVQERAEGLGGTMTIRSQPDKGTKITISIKVKTTASDA